MPSFSFFVIGAGGGPLETNLSAYLFKPYDSKWEDGIIALDAGSGVATLAHLLQRKEGLFPYFGLKESMSSVMAASRLISFIDTYLITHAHLDHISGLVLSAGSLPATQKRRIAAIDSVLHNLESVFSGHLWPKLANWQEDEDKHTYLLTSLSQSQYQPLCPNVSIRPMLISHGTSSDPSSSEPYESTAFFVRNDTTSHEFLFFGDVEPDSISIQPRTHLVWKEAAPLILAQRLSAIFLECSWPEGRKDEQLYGHLSPSYVVEELEALADEIIALRSDSHSNSNSSGSDSTTPTTTLLSEKEVNGRSGVLSGVTLYIIHCKANLKGSCDQSVIIAEQVEGLVRERNLGVEVVCVKQGMCIEI